MDTFIKKHKLKKKFGGCISSVYCVAFEPIVVSRVTSAPVRESERDSLSGGRSARQRRRRSRGSGNRREKKKKEQQQQHTAFPLKVILNDCHLGLCVYSRGRLAAPHSQILSTCLFVLFFVFTTKKTFSSNAPPPLPFSVLASLA